MATTISEAVELTPQDVRLVQEWGGPRQLRAQTLPPSEILALRKAVLVGRLQRTLIDKAPAIADETGLCVVHGHMSSRTRRAYERYNGAHADDPIVLGPELAHILAASAEVPEPPITLDAVDDPPDETAEPPDEAG